MLTLFLEVDTSSLGAAVGDIFRKSETVLMDVKPDAMLVLGDTNSCLTAYMAKRLKIPVFHMEAGNRCFDFNVPEELNRRIIDHIADFTDYIHLQTRALCTISDSGTISEEPSLRAQRS